MSSAPVGRTTAAAYLAFEREAEARHRSRMRLLEQVLERVVSTDECSQIPGHEPERGGTGGQRSSQDLAGPENQSDLRDREARVVQGARDLPHPRFLPYRARVDPSGSGNEASNSNSESLCSK